MLMKHVLFMAANRYFSVHFLHNNHNSQATSDNLSYFTAQHSISTLHIMSDTQTLSPLHHHQ